MKQINLILANNILFYRKKLGLTQAALGEKLRVSPQAVSKWELGTSAPDISLLPVLASLFECQINDLFLNGEKNLPNKVRTDIDREKKI